MTTQEMTLVDAREAKGEVNEQLGRVLASSLAFIQKVRFFHWTVRGRDFFSLHEQFETLYKQWDAHADGLAERLVRLGGRPAGTLVEVMERSEVVETSREIGADQMVGVVIDDLKLLAGGFGRAIDLAEELGDRTTVNLLDAVADDIQHSLYLFGSYLRD